MEEFLDLLPKLVPLTILSGTGAALWAYFGNKRKHRREKLVSDLGNYIKDNNEELLSLITEGSDKLVFDVTLRERAIQHLIELNKMSHQASKNFVKALSYHEQDIMEQFSAVSIELIKTIRYTNLDLTSQKCWNGRRKEAFTDFTRLFPENHSDRIHVSFILS